MNALAELQRRFKTEVLHGDAQLHESVVGNAQADAATRIAIYVDGYRLRLLEVLGNDFPSLRAMTGAQRFEQLGRAFIEAQPSQHYNARWYGGRLALFLLATPPWSQEPALAEMAALEWDMTLVFDAADEPLATFEQIVALQPEDWPGMFLQAHGGFRHRCLQWNVGEIRLAGDREETLPPLTPLNGAQEWAVWRRDLGVRYRALEADEAGVIAAVESGTRFADLCAALCEWHSEDLVAQRAAQLLKTWVEEQWLRALSDAKPA